MYILPAISHPAGLETRFLFSHVEEEIVADEAVKSTSTPLKVFSWIAKFEEENPIPEDVNQEEETPLEIERVTMTDTAELKILFTKSIVQQLPINITDSPDSNSAENIDVKDFIKLSVLIDYDQEGLDKSISNYSLKSIDSTTLTLSVNFTDTAALSPDASEPLDLLNISILLPELIRDEKTLKPILETETE